MQEEYTTQTDFDETWLTDDKIDALINTSPAPEDIIRLKTMLAMAETTVPATVLGIIYKRGLVTGAPDYEKAVYYLSIGFFGRSAEAALHLADLYYHGNGVPEDKALAMSWVHEMYDDFRAAYAAGDFGAPFAEIAYHWAAMLDDSAGMGDSEVLVDRYNAYACLLEADYALSEKPSVQLEDKRLAKAVDGYRKNLAASLGIKAEVDWPVVTGGNFLFMFDHLHDDGYRGLITFKKHGDEMTITGKRLNRFAEAASPMLVTVSDLDYCGYMTEVSMMTEGLQDFTFRELKDRDDFELSVVTDAMETDVDETWRGTITFFNEGDPVAQVSAKRYVVATAPFKGRQVPSAYDGMKEE